MKRRIMFYCPGCSKVVSQWDTVEKSTCPTCKIERKRTFLSHNEWKAMPDEEKNASIYAWLNDNLYAESDVENDENDDLHKGFFFKKKGKKVKQQNYTKKTSLAAAERAAMIVSDGVKSGNYTNMKDKLDSLIIVDEGKESYVFNYSVSKKIRNIPIMVCCVDLLYVYALYLCIATLRMSSQYDLIALVFIALSILMLILNALCICFSVREVKFEKRYSKYEDILRFNNVVIVDDIVDYAKQPLGTVIKDLEKAVKWKLVPQGNFGTDNMIFIPSTEVYNKYIEKQAIYDRYFKKQIEERIRMKERTESMQKILDTGNEYVEVIHKCNDLIGNKTISEKLDYMEKIVKMIFYEVDINPSQVDKLGLLLEYYLPTTQKLLESYIDLEEGNSSGGNARKSKKAIVESIDGINKAFESILDKFYDEKLVDLESEISALEMIMKQEGI